MSILHPQQEMATPKRKSMVDASEFSKKARHWISEGLEGLGSYLKLKPLGVLASEQQQKNNEWVGAFPGLSTQTDRHYVRGVLMNPYTDQDNFPSNYLGPHSSHITEQNAIEDSKPYKLEPYTKIPKFTAPDFREQSLLRSMSPSFYGRPSPSDRSTSPLSENEPRSSTHRLRQSHSSHRYDQSSLLRARPRIYASKAQRTTSLLQSKFAKDESLARQRLLERHRQAYPLTENKTDQSVGRLKTAYDATIGALRSGRESYVSSQESITALEQEVEKRRRMRAYNRLHEKEDWDFEQKTTPRQPAWLRTKYQGNNEPQWLTNFKNLVNRNLPISEQPRPSAYQAIMNEHDRIEKELAARKISGQAQFTPLSEEDEARIKDAVTGVDGVVVERFNVSLLKKDIQTLLPGEWLNDEIINFYGQLIMERSNDPGSTFPKVHVFSTFFYKTLSENGYEKVKRWTKKVNLFEKDYLLVPIHHAGNHWTSAVIDMKNKRISYYDSLLGNNPKCFLILRNYLDQLSRDKRGEPFDFQGWENDCPKDIPRQRNGFDCGVFTCTFIEFKSRGMENFAFSQDNMSYLRKKMILSIINEAL